MNCKNCQDSLEENAQFCDNCGAKVIIDRITFKQLITELIINVFGIDSKFFLTLRKMATKPDEVLKEYLLGVRKKYVNPFAFLAIGAGLSLLIFNYFADDFIAIQSNFNSEETAKIKEMADLDLSTLKNISEKELKILEAKKKVAQIQIKSMDKMLQFMLHYYNLLTFIFLPIYSLLSKWTYKKPHNYGEHIVINAYIYGFTTYFSIIAFFAAMLIHPSIYLFSMVAYIGYYLYAFGKLYNLSFGKSVLKLLRFLLGLILFSLIILITVAVIGFLIGKLGLI